MNPRSRSVAARINDEKIMDAAVDEALVRGVDALGFGAVARRAEVTTGALYSRFVDTSDMVAAMWGERLAAPTLRLLSDCVGLIGHPEPGGGAQVARLLMAPPKEVVVGIEALMVARRIPELDEVLTDDVSTLLRELSVSPDSGADGIRRLRGALALAAVLGCAVNNSWDPNLDEWATIFDFYALTLSVMEPSTSKSVQPVSPAPIAIETNSELRNVLIRSTVDVVARSGVQAATVARIARRARMTTGAVYTLYETKDALLLEAMEQMLASATADISVEVRTGATTGTVADATANVFALALAPERRLWRSFRSETYLAARTDRTVAAVIARIQSAGLGRYRDLYADQGMSDETVKLLSRVGQNQPIGLTIVDQFVPDFASLDFLAYAEAMLEVRKLMGR